MQWLYHLAFNTRTSKEQLICFQVTFPVFLLHANIQVGVVFPEVWFSTMPPGIWGLKAENHYLITWDKIPLTTAPLLLKEEAAPYNEYRSFSESDAVPTTYCGNVKFWFTFDTKYLNIMLFITCHCSTEWILLRSLDSMGYIFQTIQFYILAGSCQYVPFWAFTDEAY